jgi:23S rRNA G2445 N2-methylase RlmL
MLKDSPSAATTDGPTVSISVGRWMKVQGKFKVQAHITNKVVMDVAAFKVSHCAGSDIDATALRAARARSASIGAMDEISQEVQNANTHILRRQNHEDAHSNR